MSLPGSTWRVAKCQGEKREERDEVQLEAPETPSVGNRPMTAGLLVVPMQGFACMMSSRSILKTEELSR
jgi:hypothetical protein